MTIGKHIRRIIPLLNIYKLIIMTLFVYRRILHVLFWEVLDTDFVFYVWDRMICPATCIYTRSAHQDLWSVLFFFLVVVVEILYGIFVFSLSFWLYFTYQCMHIIYEFLLTTSSFSCLELFKITKAYGS